MPGAPDVRAARVLESSARASRTRRRLPTNRCGSSLTFQLYGVMLISLLRREDEAPLHSEGDIERWACDGPALRSCAPRALFYRRGPAVNQEGCVMNAMN